MSQVKTIQDYQSKSVNVRNKRQPLPNTEEMQMSESEDEQTKFFLNALHDATLLAEDAIDGESNALTKANAYEQLVKEYEANKKQQDMKIKMLENELQSHRARSDPSKLAELHPYKRMLELRDKKKNNSDNIKKNSQSLFEQLKKQHGL